MSTGTVHEVTVVPTSVHLLAQLRDGRDFLFKYKLAKRADGSDHMAGVVQVGASGTLLTQWGVEGDQNIANLLFALAKHFLVERAESGELKREEMIQLTTYNAPARPPVAHDQIPSLVPFDLDLIERAPPLPEDPAALEEPASALALGSKIVEVRDNINAILIESSGKPLLKIPAERSLLQLFKECDDEKEFAYAVAALGGLVGAVETSAIEQRTTERSAQAGSINALEAYLREHHPKMGAEITQVIEAFRRANRIRKIFPIHTDSADRVVEAHGELGLAYPIRDYKDSWRKLLGVYGRALETLLAVLTGNA